MTTVEIIARIRADMFVEPEGAYARGYNAGHLAIIRWLTEAPVIAGLKELRNTAVEWPGIEELAE